MSFRPVNRYLLVEPIKAEVKEKEQTSVLLPEGFKMAATEPYVAVKIIKAAQDCKTEFRSLKGMSVMVDASMIQEVVLNESTFYLILENYLMGVFE